MPVNRYDQACRYAAKKLDVIGFRIGSTSQRAKT